MAWRELHGSWGVGVVGMCCCSFPYAALSYRPLESSLDRFHLWSLTTALFRHIGITECQIRGYKFLAGLVEYLQTRTFSGKGSREYLLAVNYFILRGGLQEP